MTETWSNLLSGVVGAIVGGAASLAGTMLVNKMQMATAARMRMYDELLPKLERAMDGSDPVSAEGADDILARLGRASAIAGRPERRAVHDLASALAEYRRLTREWNNTPAPLPFDPLPGEEHIPPTPEHETWHKLSRECSDARQRLLTGIRALSESLGTKLR
jgi:hypothetical protein